MSIDESAAFDMISHHVLLDKLRIYKCDSTTITWLESYLKFRSQFVEIGAHKSNISSLDKGVPQGSILGPTLFNIFVNELPDVVNDYGTCTNQVHEPSEDLFGENCLQCGCLPCYADDSVYTVANKSRELNQARIIVILERLTKFLNQNHLVVNKSKTVLQEMMLKQRRCKTGGNPPQLVTLNDKGEIKIIKTKNHSILLGGTLQNDLQWKAHIESGEKPLLSAIRKKLGALNTLGGYSPKK